MALIEHAHAQAGTLIVIIKWFGGFIGSSELWPAELTV